MASPVQKAGSGHGIQPDSTAVVGYDAGASFTQAEFLAGLEQRGHHTTPVLGLVPSTRGRVISSPGTPAMRGEVRGSERRRSRTRRC